MIALLQYGGVGSLCLGALLAARQRDAAAARRTAIEAAALNALLALGLLAAHLSGLLATAPGWPAVVPGMIGLVGLTAVAMTPARAARPQSMARILIVNAASSALVGVSEPLVLAVLWAIPPIVAFVELSSRSETLRTARVFAVYMLPSVVLFAIGAVLLRQGETTAAMGPFLLALAIRQALVPVHSWLPELAERAPLGLVVAFVAPQLGVYLHLTCLAEQATQELSVAVAALAATTAVFAAAMGIAQSRTRRALGYLIMSQSALVAFGLEPRSEVAHVGALASWLVAGLSSAGLAMAVAALEARRGVLSLQRPGGSFDRLPKLGTAFLVMGLASVGLPLTLGFVAEDLLFQGSMHDFPILALALVVATGLNGMTVARHFFLLFGGTSRHAGERDLTRRESAVLTVILLALLAFGAWPAPVLSPLSPPASPPAHHSSR